MKAFFERNSYLLLLLLVYLVCELFVRPGGEFPLNDDWSYTKSVLILQQHGKIDIGDWPAMSLFTHIIWGYCFTGVFGFSFFVLRLSTMLSAMVGICLLGGLLKELSGSRVAALLGALTLLFNPFFFN